MMSKLRNIEDLNGICYRKWSELDKVSPEYLSEAGLAAKEAYRSVIWQLAFYDDLESLITDEHFMNLVSIGGKHPEYYKVMRSISRAIERSLKGSE